MKTLLSILLLAAALVAFPASATNPLTSDLSGLVVDENKRPVVGAIVSIFQLETGRMVQKTTNSKGRYLALNLRHDGPYQVVVRHPDRECGVAFLPGSLQLGMQMRRNAVLCQPRSAPPAFMTSWQWRQNKSNVQLVATDVK